MKPMSMVLGGMVVLSIASAALAQVPVDHFPSRGNAQQTDLRGWNQEPVRGSQPARPEQPAPRGNLRGDIASNARTLTAPDRQELAHPR
jgi:hypothetical protein